MYQGERGPSPETESNEITELTNNWESILSHVYNHPDNGPLLQRLIKKANTAFLMDRGWLDKMKEVQRQLEEADDEDEDQIREIITKALGETEEDDDDEDEIEEEEDDEI